MMEPPAPEVPEKAGSMNLVRMVRVWMLLVAALALVGLACWTTMSALNDRAGASSPTPERPAESSSLEALVWPSRMAAEHRWRYIVIHHSATRSATLEAIDRWHRQRFHEDAGYHFLINNGRAAGTRDGRITATVRWIEQRPGAHCAVRGHPEFNTDGIGICLIGHFDREQPTAAQRASLKSLVVALAARYRIPLANIVGHGELKNTACPGNQFPMKTFLWEVRKAYLDGRVARP